MFRSEAVAQVRQPADSPGNGKSGRSGLWRSGQVRMEVEPLERLEVVLAEAVHQRGHTLVADLAAAEEQLPERRQLSQKRGQRSSALVPDGVALDSQRALALGDERRASPRPVLTAAALPARHYRRSSPDHRNTRLPTRSRAPAQPQPARDLRPNPNPPEAPAQPQPARALRPTSNPPKGSGSTPTWPGTNCPVAPLFLLLDEPPTPPTTAKHAA